MESKTSQTVFDKLFRLLEPDAQSIDSGFRRCRLKLVKFFAWRHCEDPENLADETIGRLLKNVRANQEISADNPYSYVYAIASNVFKEYLRAKKKGGVVIDIELVRNLAGAAGTDDECKKQCMEQLSPEKRELLARYYLDDAERDEIAQEQGLSLNALRLQVHRIKYGLRHCWEDCRKHSDRMRN